MGTSTPAVKMHVVSGASTVLARFNNSAASGASAGAFLTAISDDGAALVSGDRLGGFALGGASDASSTIGLSVAIVGFAAENWSGTNAGAYMDFQTTPIGTASRASVGRFTDVGNLKIAGTANRGTTEGTAQLAIFNGTAPAGTLTNGFSFYSASGEAFAMNSAGTTTRLTYAAPSTVGTGTKTISNAADSSTNFGKYLIASVGGTTYYIPCGTVAPT
jgi:hypothetical protein